MEKLTHALIPEHTKLSDTEKEALLAHLGITIQELPKIMVTDPAIQHLECKPGDVVKIIRESLTAGRTEFFRGVVR